MPDIGLLELVVIGLVLFIVVGPERMPELFGQVSRFIRKARGWLDDARQTLKQEADQFRDPIVQAKEVVRGEIEQATDDVTGDLSKELDELRETGKVLKQRPLSEIYAEMKEKEESSDDDTSQGFMQGFSRDAEEEKKSGDENKDSEKATDSKS